MKRFNIACALTCLLLTACNETVDKGARQNSRSYAKITSPSAGSYFSPDSTIQVKVDAADPDGIDVARLWVNGNYHSIDKTAPFEFSIANLAKGDHALTIRAKDKRGNVIDSERVMISIGDQAPYARITSPENGTEISADERLQISADAYDPDGIRVIRLWVDGEVHSLDSTPPYSFVVAGLSVGEHTLKLVSKDTNSVLTSSEEVKITVKAAGSDNNGDPINAGDAIVMPLEVLGPAGTQKTVAFSLDNPETISHVYLRCNACGYHDIDLDKDSGKTKATLRVNNGPEIPLKHFIEDGRIYGNNAIRIIGGEGNYGGIGGGFRTVRFTVPVEGLVAGENRFTFKHQDAEAPSIGFRIIEMNLIENNDLSRKVLSDSQFRDDDPKDWQPPRNTPSDIAKGRELWRKRDALYDIGLDHIDGQGNGQGPVSGKMKASCAGCHAEDGRDLQYFNFSNYSIVERSKFHGMSTEEGEQIASYIRSLNIPLVAQARPWHPTYQPGPGLDSKPVYEWAAGAGVDAILDNDSDMAPHLFPNGTSLDAVRNVVDRYKTLNFRELPINIPMPEWNQWLPLFHPDDLFDITNNAILSDDRGANVGQPYYKKLFEDARANPTPRNIGALASKIKSWLRRGLECSTSGLNSGEPMRALNGAVMNAIDLPFARVTRSNCDAMRNTSNVEMQEVAKRGLTGWTSVKMWEIVHSLNLEEESQKLTTPVCSGSDDRCIDASEARGWVVDGRNVFDRAPHFIGTGGGRKFFTQNAMLGILESNSWYHLNMILNPGYRRTMPSHFAYTYSHVELLQQEAKVDQGYRFWATMIKQRQLQTNGKYGIEAGLDLRTAQPYVYYGTARRRTITDTQASVGRQLWARLAQAMIEDFVADADNATAQDWANATQNRQVQDRNSTDFSACSGVCTFDLGKFQGRNTYRVIPKLREIGVSENAIRDLINWGEKTWPRGPWSRLRQ